MKKINYKSDFDFVAKLTATNANGESVEVGFPDYDFEVIITSGCNGYSTRSFVASSIGGVTKNCFNDNGQLHIICDNHKLSAGQLHMEFRSFLPNSNYPDGTQKVVATYDLDIELTIENTGITSAEVQIVLPFLYDSAYNQAVKGGYKGTQEEYYQLASQLPNAVETANKVSKSADSLADSAERIGGAIETLATTTDAIEQGASVIKNNADTLAESATIVKASAEQIGGNIADLQASVQSIDDAVDGINQGASTIANSADTLQENVGKVSESATKVEQAVEPLVGASESLNATKQAFEMLSSEWVDGRQAIATALTNRRYPTEPTESFHAMADKITNMSYEEGWFAKIGYTDDNDGGIKNAIDYSYELAKGWNPDGSTTKMFAHNTLLIFFPMIDTSNVLVATDMLRGTGILFLPNLNLDNATDFTNFLAANMKIKYIGKIKSSRGKVFNGTFHQNNSLIRLEEIDLQSATTTSNIVYQCSALVYALIKNIGKSTLATYDFSGASVWGTGGEENRQSLIDSLITYSYDRASNGMATATIKLSATTKALLTEEEIAQITAKGFTIA